MTDVKQIGPLGLVRSQTSPAGAVAILFGYDYKNAGKPHQAAHIKREDVRKLAEYFATVNADLEANPNRPSPEPAGKELVKKAEPEPVQRVRVRRRG